MPKITLPLFSAIIALSFAFRARKAKDSAIIAENNGKVIFGKEVRGKQRVSIVSSNGESSNYLIPKGKHINFNQGEEIKKGEYLLDGHLTNILLF